NPTSWNWQVSGGSSNNATSANPTYTFANAGNYTASLIASNNFGPSINTATQSIVVLPNPTVMAASTKTLYCPSELIQISASGASTYTWNTGQTTSTITPTISTNSEVVYTVTGSDQNGCLGTSSIKIRVANVCVGMKE